MNLLADHAHADSDIKHADDVLMSGVPNRLVGGRMKLVHHKRAASIGVALEHGGNDGVGAAVNILMGDEGADGAIAVGADDTGIHAQHVPFVIHALENGAVVAGPLADVVHDRRRLRRSEVLAEPDGAEEHPGQLNRFGFLGDLIYRQPRDEVGVQGQISGLGDDFVRDRQIMREAEMVFFLATLAVEISGLDDLAGRELGLFEDQGLDPVIDDATLVDDHDQEGGRAKRHQSETGADDFSVNFHKDGFR